MQTSQPHLLINKESSPTQKDPKDAVPLWDAGYGSKQHPALKVRKGSCKRLRNLYCTNTSLMGPGANLKYTSKYPK